MSRFYFLFVLLLIIFRITGLSATCPDNSESLKLDSAQPDTLHGNLDLYYGRIWRDLYYMVDGDQFLFSGDLLPGSVTLNGKTFNDVSLRYDLFKDEIQTPFRPGGILQLNKEMVDSFSVLYRNKTYCFIRMQEDSLSSLNGYANVLYKGKTAIYVKYNKKIDHSKIGGENEKFYQITRIYFIKDNEAYLIGGKRDLLKVMAEDKELINTFIRKNKLSVSKKYPESFIPVARYFDTIRK
jgi:hypothetical protein